MTDIRREWLDRVLASGFAECDVLGLHYPVERFRPKGCDYSFDTPEEALEWDDGPIHKFWICKECGRLEQAEQQHDEPIDYLESLWPCATAKALGIKGGNE